MVRSETSQTRARIKDYEKTKIKTERNTRTGNRRAV